MKKVFAEFKEFISKGNVIDMAVGVIIGGAFSAIVTSLTDDIISPILGIFGDIDFSDLVAKVGNVEIRYGSFLTAFINFLIMAIIIFLLVKGINKMMTIGKKKEEEEAAAAEHEAPAEPEPTKEELLLAEIRDLLKDKN